MSYLKCNYEEHEQSEIISVCMEKNCKYTRWACIGCKFQFHLNHELMNINQFIEFIRQKNDSFNLVRNYLGNILQQVKSLDQYLRNITLLNEDNLQRLTLNQLNEQLNYLITFSQAEPQLIFNINQVQPLIRQIGKKIKCFKENMTLVQDQSFGNLNDQHLDIPTQNSERQFRRSFQHRTMLRENIFKNKNLNSLQLLLPPIQIPNKNLRFQDPINIEKIKINNNGKSATGNGLILCDPRLFEDSCVQYGFIWKKGFDLSIGICSKSVIMRNFFKPILGRIGHGIYMINGRGNAYSHHDEEKNNIRIDVTFKQKELIILQIDMPHKQIKWLNQQKEELYTMEVTQLEYMHVIVNLLGTVDIVDQLN